jgi:hypothetical protein
MTLKSALCLSGFAAFAFIMGCEDNGVDITEGGTRIILPGKGIDGIILGDSRDVVENKLGEPTGKGWTDGLYRSWLNYVYWEDEHNGLVVDFIDNSGDYGPVDVLTVLAPYTGKTKEGIGLGSTLAAVRGAFGEPKTTLSQPDQDWIADFFCINGKKFEVHFLDSAVSTLSIGYFIPLERDTISYCRNK